MSLPELPLVSLIIGPNNTGKSTVLEAASLLLRPHDPSSWVQAARHRDSDADLADTLWSMFRSRGMLSLEEGPQQSEFSDFTGTIDDTSRELKIRATATEDSWDSEKPHQVELRVTIQVDGNKKHDMIFRRGQQASWGEGVQNYKCFTVTPVTHRSGRTLVEHLSRIVDSGDKALALQLLQVFDSEVLSIDVSGGERRQTVVLKHKQRGVVDLASFGDGMRRAVALALALVRAKGGVLLIDELESGIHPGVLGEVTKKLVTAAQSTGVQIIATTHSLETIDALLDATAGDQDTIASYHLSRHDRKMKVTRYDHEKLRRLRAGGLDLR